MRMNPASPAPMIDPHPPPERPRGRPERLPLLPRNEAGRREQRGDRQGNSRLGRGVGGIVDDGARSEQRVSAKKRDATQAFGFDKLTERIPLLDYAARRRRWQPDEKEDNRAADDDNCGDKEDEPLRDEPFRATRHASLTLVSRDRLCFAAQLYHETLGRFVA